MEYVPIIIEGVKVLIPVGVDLYKFVKEQVEAGKAKVDLTPSQAMDALGKFAPSPKWSDL